MHRPGMKIKELYPKKYKKFNGYMVIIFIMLICFLTIIYIIVFFKNDLINLVPLFFIFPPLAVGLLFSFAEFSINSLILYQNGIQPYIPKFNTPFIRKHGFIHFDELRRIRYRDIYRTQFRIKLNAVDLFLKNHGPLRLYVDTEEDCMLIINTFERYKG
jgi:hypothetical protein